MNVALEKSGYRVLAGYRADLADGKRREVDMMHAQAVGYVWGIEDGTGARVPMPAGYSADGDASWEFGIAYAIHAAEYAREATFFRMAIRHAFGSWRVHGVIRRDH